jgi:hypothetical protein
MQEVMVSLPTCLSLVDCFDVGIAIFFFPFFSSLLVVVGSVCFAMMQS